MTIEESGSKNWMMPATEEEIISLTHINGVPIEEIEVNMRSGKYSTEGFLGRDERLKDVLLADFRTVKALGIPNSTIADTIYFLFSELDYPPPAWRTKGMSSEQYDDFMHKLKRQLFCEGKLVHLNGKRFHVKLNTFEYNSFTATQISPLNDNYSCSSENIEVLDLDGAKVNSFAEYYEEYRKGNIPNLITHTRSYPLMLVHLIRVGFYEGFKSPYRQNPEDIVKFLNIPTPAHPPV